MTLYSVQLTNFRPLIDDFESIVGRKPDTFVKGMFKDPQGDTVILSTGKNKVDVEDPFRHQMRIMVNGTYGVYKPVDDIIGTVILY